MSITTLTLLSNLETGVPSGNYDGSTIDFESDPVRAVGYYQGQGSLETVFITVNNFPGKIILRATLDFDPAQANWFDVFEYGDGSTPATDFRYPINMTGNFAWLKAVVTDFEEYNSNPARITTVAVSY
jgi:hypothetical protein